MLILAGRQVGTANLQKTLIWIITAVELDHPMMTMEPDPLLEATVRKTREGEATNVDE